MKKETYTHSPAESFENLFKNNFHNLDENFSIPIKQSEKCTERELELRIQCFRIVPNKDHFVLVNDSLIIPCLVNNQHGKVQWRAKNFVLGYDRSVPGMPRLQIVGDVTKGEHNLHLNKVQLSDSGEYECQVQPVDIHPLLRRRSTLHVTNLPTSPFIIYKREIPKNNEIIIDSNQDVNNILTLTCESTKGIPPPTFRWMWNTRSLETPLMTEIKIDQTNPNQSILNIPLSFFKSGHTISCLVRNKATELAESENMKFLASFESKIKIIIYTKPGLPKLEYNLKHENLEAVEGRSVDISCSLNPIGIPNSLLKWRLKSINENSIIDEQTTIYDNHYRTLITRLTLTNISRSLHYSQISCISTHPLATQETIPLFMTVKHNPNYLYIVKVSKNYKTILLRDIENIAKEKSNQLSIEGIENEDVNLVCVSSSYFGKLKMKWQMEFSEQFDESRSLLQSLLPLERKEVSLSLNNTLQSVITQIIKFKRTFNTGFIQCKAISEDGQILTAKEKFNVFYLPKVSVISGYVSQFPLHEGDMIQLTCCAYRGNPTPNLRWYQNKKIVLEKKGNNSILEEQTLVFISRVFRKDNGQQLYCEASCNKIKSKTVKSNQITVNVVFPPSELRLTCENCNPQRIITNTTSYFLCETSSSNPGSFMTWKILNCSSNKKCSSTILEGSMSTNAPGSFNGWRSQSRVNILLDHTHDGLILECESTLSHKMFPDRYKSLIKTLTFQILHPPVILNFQNQSRQTLLEGSNLTLLMFYSANPTATHCIWLHNEKIISRNNSLIITNIKANESGIYKFKVFNSLGSTFVNVNINVEYKPRILNLKATIINENAFLLCSAISNPMFQKNQPLWNKVELRDNLVNPTDTYHHKLSLSLKTICPQKNNCLEKQCPSKLLIHSLKYSTKCVINTLSYSTQIELNIKSYTDSDFGWYMCSFDNGISYVVSKLIHLKIAIKPKHINVLQYSNQGGQIHHFSSLICCFLSHLKPEIIWSCPPHNASKPANNITQVAEGTYCGYLKVFIQNKNQYGLYYCQAFNEKGKSKEVGITLKPLFKPKSPLNSDIYILSNGTVLISWTQMPNSGGTQIFQVRWKKKEEGSKFHYKTIAGSQYSELLSISLQLNPGIYITEIGTSSTLYSNIEYCCKTEFVISDIKTSVKNLERKVVQHSIKLPQSPVDVPINNTLLITFMSTIVCVLTIIVLIFIFIYLMKYRRKTMVTSQKKNLMKSESTSYSKSENITKLNEEYTSVPNFSQDFQIEIKPNDEENALNDEEKIKFLTSLSTSIPCNYIPLNPSTDYYQMDQLNQYYSENENIKRLSMSTSLLTQNSSIFPGIYGKFIMQNYQPCNCQIGLTNEELIIVTSENEM